MHCGKILERPRSHNFIAGYGDTYAILLSVTIGNLFLCLIYKSHFITGMYG